MNALKVPAAGVQAQPLPKVEVPRSCGAVGFAILPLEPQYVFKYLILILVIVSLSGFGNIKMSAQMSLLVGVVDTAGRFLFPSIGAFLVVVILI